MVPTLVDAPPAGADWLHEIKQDGYRVSAVIDGGAITLRTRRGEDWSHRFRPLLPALDRLQLGNAILDGEVAAPGANGVTHLSGLLDWMRTGRGQLVFYAFDVLWLDGEDLRSLPLVERKARLGEALSSAAAPLVVSTYHEGRGPELLAGACAIGAEGIVSKRRGSRYVSGRTREWIKAKCLRESEFWIVGFTAEYGQITGLLLGEAVPAGFRLVGQVAVGLDVANRANAAAALESLRRTVPTVIDPPRQPSIRWADPALIARVRHLGMIAGKVRHPVLVGLRLASAAPGPERA
jgi:bifunctional non-homologous end joining protein LigD